MVEISKEKSEKYKLRLCEINGVKGYFHKWISESSIYGENVMTNTLALVEFSDGTIGKFLPKEIKFID